MQRVCISIKSLYQEKGMCLNYCQIEHSSEDGGDYYDLVDSSGTILCMDGEECDVISTNEGSIELCNINSATHFQLSKNEFDFAVFKGEVA